MIEPAVEMEGHPRPSVRALRYRRGALGWCVLAVLFALGGIWTSGDLSTRLFATAGVWLAVAVVLALASTWVGEEEEE